MQIWSEAELEFLRKNITKATVTEIYDEFEKEFGDVRSYDSVQKKVKQLRAAFSPGDGEAETDSSEDETVLIPYGDKIVVIPSSTKANLRNERKMWLKEFVEFIRQNPTRNTVIPPVENGGSSLVVALSDLHIGQQNKGYDIEIAKQRLGELPEKLYRAVGMTNIDEVVFLLVGDIVEGENIYPSQAHHIVCSTMDQVEIGAQMVWGVIKKTRDTFKVPVRVVCVQGNHGNSEKGSSEKTNWDNVLYHALKILVSSCGDSKIGFDCDYSEFKLFKVKDKKGLIYHKGVKHNGTPAMREKIAGWVYSKKMNFMVSGHWHEWKVGGWADVTWMANGSLCGPNDLSERMAQEGPARQGYFLVTAGKPLWGFGFIEWKEPVEEINEIPPDPPELQLQDGSDPRKY
jgi:hypothetical protein